MKKSIGAQPLVYPTPVFIVGTYDKNEKPNIAAVAWGGICCSQPPAVAIALRKATYTYGNILERKAFTVNIPSEKQVREADYCGIASGKNVDKFKVLGLTPVRSTLVDAPYGEEFPITLECALIHHIEIGLHTQFIGEIKDIKIDDACLIDGKPRVAPIKPLQYAPGDQAYYGLGEKIGDAFSIGKEKA